MAPQRKRAAPPSSAQPTKARRRRAGGAKTLLRPAEQPVGIAQRDARVAVVVRSHSPAAGGLERVVQWVKDIKVGPLSARADVWVSIDATKAHGKATRARVEAAIKEAGLEPASDIRFHEYTEQDMLDAYPVLEKEMRVHPMLGLIREFRTGVYSLAWGFHSEPLNLWYQALPRDETGTKPYAHVWVLEDDVGFSGDLSWLVSQFDDSADDLIADGIYHVRANWMWSEMVSESYKASIPLRARLHAREHVQRVSGRLLDHLDRLAREEGFVGWSEQATPSVCHFLRLHWSQFPRHLVGTPFSWDGRVTRAQWDQYLNGRSPRPKRKLYHALKW